MTENLRGGLANHNETMICDADLALEEIEELEGVTGESDRGAQSAVTAYIGPSSTTSIKFDDVRRPLSSKAISTFRKYRSDIPRW